MPDKPSELDDGLLQASEAALLKLDADWVVLSACNTAAGDGTPAAGGLSGLAQAFFYAGARNVAVSLWNVNDSATAALMKSFYLNLRRGLPKREALREAKLSLLRSSQPSWRHPYFWAAFVLEGQGH